MKNTALALLSILFLATHSPAENIVFPPGAGTVNVKTDLGAKGDGVTDDTAAIQKWIADKGVNGGSKTLYFPNGTYLVSDSLGFFDSKAHSKHRYFFVQGQSEAGAVIKLKDRAAGFGDASKPKILFSYYDGQGTGDAMYNFGANLTFDVGSGNPGAIALRYMSNNMGALRNITCRSSDPAGAGFIGLDMRQGQNGPNLVSYITVDGFDTGISTGSAFSLVFEHILLRNQRELGFYNCVRTTIRDLRSENKVTALHQSKTGGAELVLVEAQLTGGDPKNTAIVSDNPKFFLRDIVQSGYGVTAQDDKGNKATGNIAEAVGLPGSSLFGAKPASLRLPIKETPEVPWESDLSKWVLVQGGDTDAVQAAFDEAAKKGATTVCFPIEQRKTYTVDRPIRVTGSVNRIIGMETEIRVEDPKGGFKEGMAVFNLENLTSDTLVVERFTLFGGWHGLRYVSMIDNKAGCTVVIRNVKNTLETKTKGTKGEWFIDDYSPSRGATLQVGRGEKMWMRQFNPEAPEQDMIHVDGGELWILGLKTEGRANHLTVTGGGKAEVLGGVSYQSWDKQPVDPPMFKVVDSEASFTLGITSSRYAFTTAVEETLGGKTKSLPVKEVSSRFLSIYRSGR